MGLDMYLNKKTYVKNWDHQTPEERHTITIKLGNKIRKDIKPERISEIVEEVGYWRKANHIHKWFVDNVQDGKDDCGEYYVSKEQLKKLRDVCEEVIKDRSAIINANKLLPVQSGFFFGNTKYDEYYFDKTEYTFNLINNLLKEISNGDYYYSSSW